MTAEVVVMNKLAVALAADSAATVSPKVFNSAEKLFMLVPGQPVGFMIYNYANFMQLPWETIVKKYRQRFGDKPLNTLQDYAEDFIAFLGNADGTLYTDQQLELSFAMLVTHYLVKIRKEIVSAVFQRVQDSAKQISLKEISDITNERISHHHDRWMSYKNQFADSDIEKIQTELRKYHDVIERARNGVFDQLPLSKENKDKLEVFCYSLVYKDYLTDLYTGIVFSGFGENDVYPVCVEYVVENCFGGCLKYKKRQEMGIDSRIVGRVIPFAQKKEVSNILDGIHPDFEVQLRRELIQIQNIFSSTEVTNLIKKLKKSKRTKLIAAIESLQVDKQNNLLSKVQDNFNETHTDSILQTVAMLPKDELANMAESLVNITSFVRKVSMDIETVGGPIDVAVISKKDGFIWIKRKHYFDQKYNPHFVQTGGVK